MAVKKSASKMKKKTSNGKSAASKMSAKKMPSVKDTMSKSGMIKTITDMTGVAKRDVVAVLDAQGSLIEAHIKPKGPGKFVLPGVLKMTVVKKPARPARKGRNPFTGEEIMFKAKPAYKTIKIKPLKKLKEMVD